MAVASLRQEKMTLASAARAAGLLTRWRRWLVRHGTPIACAVLVLIGSLLVVRGLAA